MNLRRTRLIAALTAALVLASAPTALFTVGASTATAADTGDRPNIVVVMADDMRYDDVQYMPATRRLIGERGATFRNSFSSYPLCCPARASFFSGLFTHRHEVYWHTAPYGFGSFDDSRTLATAMHDAGYATGFVGKYLNLYGTQPSRVTGEPSLSYVPAGWDEWHALVQGPPGSRLGGGTHRYFRPAFNRNGELETFDGDYQTDVIGDKVVGLVEEFSAGDQPFFIAAMPLAPHYGHREKGDPRPYTTADGTTYHYKTPARPDWVKGRFDDVIRRAPGLNADGSQAPVHGKPAFMASADPIEKPELRRLRALARQRAEALYVLDRQVRRIVRTVEAAGELDDTVFVFTSDNGYFLGEHRRRSGKVFPHEPSLRVPLMIAGPGVTPGRRYEPAQTVDVTATLANLAGATRHMPTALDGRSLVRILAGRDRGWRFPVLTEAWMNGIVGGLPRHPAFSDERNHIGIRTSQFKYLRYATGETELYDLDRDPGEHRNLATSLRYVAELRALDRVWRQVKDCAADSCQVLLPDSLRRGPRATRRATEQQLAQVRRDTSR